MSETCPSATRQRAERVARGLRHVEACVGADVIDPKMGTRDDWTVEATFTRETVPNEAVQILADQDCELGQTTPRGLSLIDLVAVV